MKEFIKNYYNIEIKKIHNNYFYYDNEKIKIIKYNKKENINKYINIINDKRISEFVLNKNNEIITKYKEENIILLKINDLQKEIDLEYLNIFNIDNEKLDIRDLIKEWENLIDDSEIKIKDIEKDYYIGLSEIAISMMKKEKSDIKKVIGHDIKFNEITREEYNNPLNFVRVDIIYNISNYVKYKFFNEQINMIELEHIIKKLKKEQKLESFFAYMLYANYYFETENREKIIKKHKEYEEILLFIKENIKK